MGHRMMFVNLPVKDLDRAKAFFGKLGFAFNPRVTDDKAACMVVSDTIFVMLLTEAKFKEFTPKQIQTQEERVKLVYRIKIEVENPRHELKNNMPADAVIVLGR